MSGSISLINSTPFDWVLDGEHDYQLGGFDFPETVFAYSSASISVDFDSSLIDETEDDAGEAYYSIQDTDGGFTVAANNDDGFDITVTIDGMSTSSHADGDVFDLGFVEGSGVHWILAGPEDDYRDTNSPTDWMQQLMSILRDRPLRHVCMPGSHDAGMSEINNPTAFSTDDNTQTQNWGIGSQLEAGSRFFDWRPVVSGGAFRAGHYSDLGDFLQWQGAAGQSLEDTINEVNDFTAANGELVILWLSHAYDTDNGYVDFTQDNWDDLFAELNNLDSLFTEDHGQYLQDVTMDTYIGDGTAAVLVVAEIPDEISIDKDTYPWAYRSGDFGTSTNLYSETDDVDDMMDDQLSKLSDYRQLTEDGGADDWFVLSWTLTQQGIDTVGGELSSIRNLAAGAWHPLFDSFNSFTEESFPNVLMVDNYGSGVAEIDGIIPCAFFCLNLALAKTNGTASDFNGTKFNATASNLAATPLFNGTHVDAHAAGLNITAPPPRQRLSLSDRRKKQQHRNGKINSRSGPTSSAWIPGDDFAVNDLAGLATAINHRASQNGLIAS